MKFVEHLVATLFVICVHLLSAVLVAFALYYAIDRWGYTFLWGYLSPFIFILVTMWLGICIVDPIAAGLEKASSPASNRISKVLSRGGDRVLKLWTWLWIPLGLAVSIYLGAAENPFTEAQALYRDYALRAPRYDDNVVRAAQAEWDSRDWAHETDAGLFDLKPEGGWRIAGNSRPQYCFSLVNRSGGLLVSASVVATLDGEAVKLPLVLSSPVGILERRKVCAELSANDLTNPSRRALYRQVAGGGGAPEPEARLADFRLRPVNRKKELSSWLDQAVSE